MVGNNITVNASATVKDNKKSKSATNAKQQKIGSNADDGNNQNYKKTDDEFGGWCTKALSAHVDVIDGKRPSTYMVLLW